MIAVRTERTAYVDVDHTLIFPISECPFAKAEDYIVLGDMLWLPNEAIINQIRQHKARGHGIVVWNQGGAKWAEDVVVALGIEHLVDVVAGKPDWIWDDKEASEWMGKRYYQKPEPK